MKVMIMVVFWMFYGCASNMAKLGKVDPGMNTSEVTKVMGQRDAFKQENNYLIYSYMNKTCDVTTDMFQKCDFFVVFKDGKVVETASRRAGNNNPFVPKVIVEQR